AHQDAQANTAGETVEVPLYCECTEGHTVTFSATGLPAGLTIDEDDGTISGTIEYGAASDEPYHVVILAVDDAGGASDAVEFAWYVLAPQVSIQSVPDQASVVGASISLTINANSSDGEDLTYSATGLPSGLSINSSTGAITGTISGNADLSSPYSVTIT